MEEEKEVKLEDITIPKSQLEEMMKRLQAIEKDRDMLLQVADKRQLGIYYQRNRGKIPSHVNLRTMMVVGEDGKKVEKVIVGWVSTKDEPPQLDPATGRWIPEVQKCKLMYEDGTISDEMHQVHFTRNYKQVEAEVKSKVTDEVTGDVALKVIRLDNQKEYDIGINFVN